MCVCVCALFVAYLVVACYYISPPEAAAPPFGRRRFFRREFHDGDNERRQKKTEKFVRLVVAFDSGHSDPPPGRRYIPPCKMFGVSRVRQSTVSH